MENELLVSSTSQEPPPSFPHKRIVVIILVLFLVGVTGVFLLKRVPRNMKTLSSHMRTQIIPTPTLFPLQEVTIPYLRKQTYSSKLGNLEKDYEGSGYTAYLTSYTSDGLKINGLLTIPTGDRPSGGFPAIVFVHGYIPPKEYQTTGEAYSSYVDYLARSGFVVFKIDLRGHGDSEGEAGGVYFGADYVRDTLNAYAALQASDFINPKKIGMWGHSMAGNILLRSFAIKPDIPAVDIWAGAVYSYSDREKYGIHDASYQPPSVTNSPAQNRSRRISQLYGEASSGNAFWKQMAPTYFLNDLKGAIEMNHAVDDPVVNIGYSRDLMALLDKTNVPHELHEYPSGGHNITGVSFNEAMQNTVTFFDKYLK